MSTEGGLLSSTITVLSGEEGEGDDLETRRVGPRQVGRTNSYPSIDFRTNRTHRRAVHTFRVRQCLRKDLESAFEIAEEYTAFDATPTLADIEGLFARNPEYFYVAENDSRKVIGFITGYEKKGIPENVLLTWNARRVGYVDLMAVESSSRRKGLGTALLQTLLDHFKQNGIDVVNLDVPATQEPAVRLYQKLGFNIRAHSMRKRLG